MIANAGRIVNYDGNPSLQCERHKKGTLKSVPFLFYGAKGGS